LAVACLRGRFHGIDSLSDLSFRILGIAAGNKGGCDEGDTESS
jgi:hypothetical protein